MKYTFLSQAAAVIETISQIDVSKLSDDELKACTKPISDLQDQLQEGLVSKKLSKKHYAKLRRQLSFIHEYVYTADVTSRYLRGTDKQLRRQMEILVSLLKNVQSGEALTNIDNVKLGLSYGVIHLSDFEIKKLIEMNKK